MTENTELYISGSARASLGALYRFLKPGELLDESITGEFYQRMWAMAQADSFEAAAI